MSDKFIQRNASIAMAMAAYGISETKGYSFGYRDRTNTIRKGEAKKCKSCKQYGITCKVPPMQIACEKHERRKKK